MKKYFQFLISVSRPRFWLYIGGTYAVGYAAGAARLSDFLSVSFWLYLVFFLILANIFLYGINDFFDVDTDQFNTKKGDRENLLLKSQRTFLCGVLIFVASITGLIITFASSARIQILLGMFFLLSFLYSAPPVRFKARPFLDFASNILYGLPGFIGYVQTSGHLPSWQVVIAVFFWTSAMHLFSAIPDITSDKQAGLLTTAVLVKTKFSLLLCFIFWTVSWMIVVLHLKIYVLGIVGALYPVAPLLLLRHENLIQKIYWYFPIYNALVGFVLFILAVIDMFLL